MFDVDIQSIMFDVDIQSIMFFFIIINILFLVLMILLLSLDRRSKTLLSITLANLFQLLAIIFIYIDSYNRTFTFLPFSNLFGVAQVVFWMITLLFIFKISRRYIPYITFLVLSFVSTVVIQLTSNDITLIRAITTLMMVLVEIHTLIYLYKKRKNLTQPNLIIASSIIGYFTLYHGVRMIIRFLTVLSIESVFDGGHGVLFFVLTSLSNNVLMMILLLYLHYRDSLRKLHIEYNHDNLTKVLTRSSFFEEFYLRKHENRSCTNDFALLMLDLDDFKHVNDDFGHLVGDEVLYDFASIIKSNLRDSDLVGRYGGEEFLILFSINDETPLKFVLDRLFFSVRNSKLSSKNLSITFSAGVTVLPCATDMSLEDIIELSDQELYKAKSNGKNQYSILYK